MKNKISKKTIGLLMMSLLLVASIGIGSALAYFTTYTEAKGGVELDLNYSDTKISEKVVEKVKNIIINNQGDADCYVRVKAIVSEQYKDLLVYSEPDNAGNWLPSDDGYYYYKDIIISKGSTTQLDVELVKIVETAKDDFNVIIVQESTPVLYKADGTPYADWSVKAEISESYDVAPLE